jgi:hypothetical protein
LRNRRPISSVKGTRAFRSAMSSFEDTLSSIPYTLLIA